MNHREKAVLQRGMNFRLHPQYSVILMSVRKNAPYHDQWHEDRGLLEYEGHDEPRRPGTDPKRADQPMRYTGGSLAENGMFYEAAIAYKQGHSPPEVVHVYEKIANGIWSDRGTFELIDACTKQVEGRKVFRFFMRPIQVTSTAEPILRQTRMIPTSVKVEVWRRDGGRCVICQSNKNLHFDHDVPFSKGGSSVTAANVRLLCAKHNLQKGSKVQSLLPFLLAISGGLASRAAG
ncbi:MAG: HNH endonuclease [Planctomycetes bacterium]|nr:HNH endonuclease [Planctomycetota bacterium]MBI3835159.1 HNH endonuclease [Planctomycetota bacterium]